MKFSEQVGNFVAVHRWLVSETKDAAALPEPWRTQKLKELQVRAAQLAIEHERFVQRYGGVSNFESL